MRSIRKIKRRGLSQTVTTLLILTTSVLMAGGTLTFYGGSIAANAMKMEQLYIRTTHIWTNSSGSQAALHVENVGGRDALVDALEFSDVEEPWDSIYYADYGNASLVPVCGLNITAPFALGNVTFQRAQGSVLIPAGESLFIYVDQPDSIDTGDLGNVVTIIVYSSTLPYITVDSVETP